jgi:flavorubredoxin
MSAIQIAENIYWVGAVDWSLRSFHGHTYTTRRGSSYNAYLIIDEKVTLIDTVHGPFAPELINNIRQVVDPAKIDYIVANHVETDHSGALPEVLKLCPKAKVFGTARCKDGLYRYYYVDMDFQVVKTGDKLPLGKRTLEFIEAPMIHWPDSMFTYIVEDQILMPNDAFGQHLASSGRFDDQVDQCTLMEEATIYYANILWPLSALIAAKLTDLQKMNLPIKMIAPSHGIIWRQDPMKIVTAYSNWAKNETRKKVIVFYETMWGATEKMARKMTEALADADIEVKLYDVVKTDRTDLATDMLDARGFLVGSSTHDNDMLPTIAGFLEFVKGLKPKNRIAAVFGSYGWGGGAVKEIEGVMKEAGIELVQPSLGLKFMPSPDDLKACYDFGKAFAKKISG